MSLHDQSGPLTATELTEALEALEIVGPKPQLTVPQLTLLHRTLVRAGVTVEELWAAFEALAGTARRYPAPAVILETVRGQRGSAAALEVDEDRAAARVRGYSRAEQEVRAGRRPPASAPPSLHRLYRRLHGGGTDSPAPDSSPGARDAAPRPSSPAADGASPRGLFDG